MFKRHILIVLLCASFPVNTAFAVVAEFTGPLTYGYPLVSADKSFAMAINITGSPTINEILLPLSIYTGGTGPVIVELCEDSNGHPASTPLMQVSKALSELPRYHDHGNDRGEWISFTPDTPVAPSPGTYWIVCRLDPGAGSYTKLYWHLPSGYDNLYGTWYDSKSSADGGTTWDLVMYDFYFRVFGDRVAIDTNSTVEADPNVIEASESSLITVIVKDANGNPCQGTVTLTDTGSGGAFDQNSLTLDENGMASTNWAAPASLSTYTITADFASGQGYNGLDFNPSSNDVTITVQEFAGMRDTDTSVALSKYTVKTHEQITVTATVTDLSVSPVTPVTVDDGKVSFRADDGTFSETLVPVSSGTATTNWIAPDTNGTYNIYAYYQGNGIGAYNFRRSEDNIFN